jgi:hypothetical protein
MSERRWVLAGAAAAAVVLGLGPTASATWTDGTTLAGTSLRTVHIVAPDVECGTVRLGSLTVGWDPVPGATSYVVHYGLNGSLVQTVGSNVLTRTFTGVVGKITVQAVFGSPTWISAPSVPLAYSALAGLLATCA